MKHVIGISFIALAVVVMALAPLVANARGSHGSRGFGTVHGAHSSFHSASAKRKA